jgi:hypothetical protein
MIFLRNESGIWDSAAVRVSIYFGVAFLSTFLTQTEAVTAWSDWNPFQWLRVVAASLVAGLVAVRAFLDQTLSREDNKQPEP